MFKMKKKKLISLLLLFISCVFNALSQVYNNPNIALKSHETLEILKVEITPRSTMIYLSVENRRSAGGSFCADRNIYMISPDATRMKLIQSKNIPVCPDTYNFRSVGEKLQFILEFPPLKNGTKWIDIIEDCSSNCFWFYGVTLDNELNARLDEVFTQASRGLPANNVLLFKNILDDIDNQNQGIEGSLYINIINAALENSDTETAAAWYKRMTESRAPRLNQYLKYLNDRGIKY
jgi:hypothetical protein